jgi:glycosyltransferase involved in cell wall biosynthesis
MKQLVDVVIPAFNAAGTVRSAIHSIQQQTLTAIRIVVVNDGSTDDTQQIVEEIAAADPRVELVLRPHGGIVDARNAGLARCKAEFVAWLDADDLAAPDRLEKQVAYLREHPDCVAVSGAFRHIDATGRFLGTICRMHSPSTADPTRAPSIEPHLIQPFTMARRSAVQAAGGYRDVLYAEDIDLCWRMQELGRLHNMDDVLGDVRMHSASVSAHSIISGRIMAFSSQLATISALRRRSGRSDLAFSKKNAARYFETGSLSDIFALGSVGLDQDEIDYLEIAVAGRLLEITSYRQYELELSDCRFIRSAVRKHARRIASDNHAALARSSSGSAARLAHQGLFREAAALVSPWQYPATVARLLLRAVAKPALRERLRRAMGRGSPAAMK